MNRQMLSVAGLALLMGGQIAPGQPTDGNGSLVARRADTAGPNAALVYYSVWAGLADADLKVIGELSGEMELGKPLPQRLHDAVMHSKDGVSRLVRAAAIKRCDFELDYSEGFSLLLPHLAKMRTSARLLRCDAFRLMAEGKADEAADRYAAILGMARHAAQDRVLISSLVSVAITQLVVADLVDSGGASQLTPAGRSTVLASLDRLGGVEGFAIKQAIENEKRLAIDVTLMKYEGPDAGQRFEREVLKLSADTSRPADTSSTGGGGQSREQTDLENIRLMDGPALRAEVLKLEPYYEGVLRAWDAPDAKDRLAALNAHAETGGFGLLGQYLLPSLGKVRTSQDKGGASLRSLRESLTKPSGVPVK